MIIADCRLFLGTIPYTMPIYDISVPLRSAMPIFPGDVAFELIPMLRIADGKVCNLSQLRIGTHTGTHLDAPWHFNEQGQRIDELDLSRLIGPAYVADLRGQAVVTAESLEAASIPADCSRLLLRTDNETLWAQAYFQGEFVSLAPDAARWIVERGIDLVGIDYLSVEQYGAPKPEAHWTLCGASKLIVEGLNLTDIPAGTYELICLPLKIEGADGSPARALLRTL